MLKYIVLNIYTSKKTPQELKGLPKLEAPGVTILSSTIDQRITQTNSILIHFVNFFIKKTFYMSYPPQDVLLCEEIKSSFDVNGYLYLFCSLCFPEFVSLLVSRFKKIFSQPAPLRQAMSADLSHSATVSTFHRHGWT